LGEPLPHKDEMPSFDWDNDTEFEFAFDLGIAPEVDTKLSAKDKIPFYTIKVDDKLIDKYVENYTQQLGKMEPQDKSAEKSMLKAIIKQLDADGNVMEDGISVDEGVLSVEVVKDDKIKKKFIGKKVGDKLNVDLKKAYPNDTEIAGLLKIDKEKVGEITGEFEIDIIEINGFVPAEVNQELFDKIFGEGTVKSEEEFREKVAEEAKKGLLNDSEFRFKIDTKETLVKKFKKELPVEFLKRWIFTINEGKFTKEQIDTDFDKFAVDLKWQLIKDKFGKEQNIEVSQEELQQGAIENARRMFMQYGMGNVPDENLLQFADNILQKDDERRKIFDGIYENKIVEHIKTVAKIDEKEISVDKFNKLFEESK
ncbi:MAG: trigger factor, partial [Bacteroidales bacterium]|nr:trigger factor [Bacteroidales bacterium]